MNKVVLSSLVIVSGLLFVQPAFAAADHPTTDQKVVENAVPLVEVGNKVCPVSGEKIGEMGEVVKYTYNGKSYNLCCAMCAKDFKKDSDKYSKIAEDEVAKEKAQEKTGT